MWSEFWIHQWLCPIHLWNGRVNVSNCIKEQRFYLFFALCIKLLQATSKSRQAGDDRTWQSIAYKPFCLTYAWSARMLCQISANSVTIWHWTRDLCWLLTICWLLRKRLEEWRKTIRGLACENIRFSSTLRRRGRFVPSGEERGETDVFAG